MGGLLAIAAEKLEGSNTPVDFTEKWGDASISDESAATRMDTFLVVQERSETALRSNLEALLELRKNLPDRSKRIRKSDTVQASDASEPDNKAHGAVVLLPVRIAADPPFMKI